MSRTSSTPGSSRAASRRVRRVRSRNSKANGAARHVAARPRNMRRTPRVETAPAAEPQRRTLAVPRPPRWFGRVPGLALRGGLALGIAYGLLLGAREVYEYATTSARFEVRSLIFDPTPHVSDDAVRAQMQLEPGTNILALDLEALTEKIVAHPWVASAKVTRHLPDTIEVEVTEHVPSAVVLAGHFYLVDSDGRPFKRVERGERGALPIITGIDRAQLGRDRAGSVARIARAVEILQVYAEKKRPRVGELHLEEDGGVTLYTQQTGTQLRFGRRPVADGLERYDALRAALGTRADGLAVVHLDSDATTDRRERVVARFYDERDERAVLADAASMRTATDDADAPRGGASNPKNSPASPPAKPEKLAPKKKRIPRHH